MKLLPPEPSNVHWYTATGESAHDADLRRARKERLYPSVTSVLQIKAKPGLDAWKRQEAILAALTLPRLDGESEQDFASRVVVDMDATGSKAAAIGTAIHAYAEGLTGGENIEPPKGYEAICAALRCWIEENLEGGVAESTMVSEEYGYAGRQDWTGIFSNGKYGILDFKTQNVKPGKKPVFYPEHCYQLAAYAEGKPMEMVNLIIGVNHDNPIIAEKRWTIEEAENGWAIFKHCLAIWQLERGYDPRRAQD